MDEEEVAAGLGPGWPNARVLANLQQHCIALSYEACQHSSQGSAATLHQLTPPALSVRSRCMHRCIPAAPSDEASMRLARSECKVCVQVRAGLRGCVACC